MERGIIPSWRQGNHHILSPHEGPGQMSWNWRLKRETAYLVVWPQQYQSGIWDSCTRVRGRRLEATWRVVCLPHQQHTLASTYECDMPGDRPQRKHPRVSEGLTQTALPSDLGTVKLDTFNRDCQGALGSLQLQKNEPLCLELCPSPSSSVALLNHVLVTYMWLWWTPWSRHLIKEIV